MRLICTILVLLTTLSLPLALPQTEVEWNLTFGGSVADLAEAILGVDDGGFLVAGQTYSFGSGKSDALLLRVGADGALIWNRTYGGAEWDQVYDVISDGEGGFVLAGCTRSWGGGEQDAWVFKIDEHGILLWSKYYGGTGQDIAYGILRDPDGSFTLVGSTRSQGAGGSDLWMLKIDSEGEAVWDRAYGGELDEVGYCALLLPDGILACGFTKSFGSGMEDVYLVRTDLEGTLLWQKAWGDEQDDRGWAVLGSDGEFYVVGRTRSQAGDSEVLLLRVDPDGDVLWNRTYGGPGQDEALAALTTEDGSIVTAGLTESLGAGKSDVHLLRLTSGGDIITEATFGGAEYDEAKAIVEDDGGYIMAGWTSSSGEGDEDVYVLKVVPETWPILSSLLASFYLYGFSTRHSRQSHAK